MEKGPKSGEKARLVVEKSCEQRRTNFTSALIHRFTPQYPSFPQVYPQPRVFFRREEPEFSTRQGKNNYYTYNMTRHWVEEIFQRCNLWKTFSEQAVLPLWSQTVGARVSKLSQVERFANGILYVGVVSSTVAQELSFLEPRYVVALNTKLGADCVKEIRFVPGRFETISCGGDVQPLSKEDRETARSLFVHLDNPNLRSSFERLYLTLREREEYLLANGGKRCPSCGAVFRDAGTLCPGCRFEHIEEK